jgi:hypothetical protein
VGDEPRASRMSIADRIRSSILCTYQPQATARKPRKPTALKWLKFRPEHRLEAGDQSVTGEIA